MWKLSARYNKLKQWVELGEFQSISDAAERVLELEGSNGALFFRVYVDPITAEQSDADILSRLEYQSAKGLPRWSPGNRRMAGAEQFRSAPNPSELVSNRLFLGGLLPSRGRIAPSRARFRFTSHQQ